MSKKKSSFNKFDKFNKQEDILKLLSKNYEKINKNLWSTADKELVETLCDFFHNLLKGKIQISPEDLEKIKSFIQPIRKLISKSSLKNKRKILVQQGGFLQYLIPAALTTITSLIDALK
jgi:hypothetical protein